MNQSDTNNNFLKASIFFKSVKLVSFRNHGYFWDIGIDTQPMNDNKHTLAITQTMCFYNITSVFYDINKSAAISIDC